MKLPRFPLFALCACFAVASPAAEPADNANLLPQPPMQDKPWTPPDTKLPPVVVSAIKELFDQGMADPRGCEYREVEIAGVSPADYPANANVHAWVLPGDGQTRYAISWNGLVYPVVKIGDVVDLRKDFLPATGGQKQFGTRWGEYDYNSVSEKSAMRVKVALLLRIGEAGLAEQLWHDGWQVWTGSWITDTAGANSDPYADMAQQWLDAWYQRGLAAHTEGNDAIALELFHSLLPVEQKVKAFAQRRKFPEKSFAGQPYLDELRQLPDLIADQERRAKEPPYIPVLKSGAPASGPALITALIRDLELVRGVEMTSPGDNEPYDDPIVQTLIKQGEPAVGPLIACLEEDPPRLTRTVYSYRERFQGPVEYVYEPAYIILGSILKTTMTVPLPTDTNRHELSLEERKALAAKFRTYWSQNKNMTPPERWYSALQDDNATPREWFEAVKNIVQPVNEVSFGPSLFTGATMGIGSVGAPVAMRGDPLRAKANPSVSDLIIKRFSQMLPAARVEQRNTYIKANDSAGDREVSYTKISNLLIDLADWDGKARIDDLKNLAKKLNARFPNVDGSSTSSIGVNASLYEKRAALGDSTALQEYADWVGALPPKAGLNSTVLSTMERHPNDPAIRALSDRMFGDKNSPWCPVSPADLRQFKDLMYGRMLGVQAFREELLRIFDDTTAMGFTRTLETGELRIQMNDERDYEEKEYASLLKLPFRVCDYFASKLSDIREFPEFSLTWTQARRDTAIAAFKQMLKQYGGNYQTGAGTPSQDTWPEMHMIFPKPDHPATEEDVAQGRAIFALTGETRLCPMPQFPLYANRPGSKEGADTSPEGEADGKIKMITRYDTTGFVWQAEEVKVDGKWQRYYGFAGRHQLEKVAAAEIEFPRGGQAITPQLNAMLIAQTGTQQVPLFFNSLVAAGPEIPLTLVVKVCNHSSQDQEVPASFILPANAGKVLPAAINLSLSYSEKISPLTMKTDPGQDETTLDFMSRPVDFDYGAWIKIPLKKEVTVADAKPPGPLLGAAGELTLLQIDLRDYFDMSRPGTYRLQAAFKASGGNETKPLGIYTYTVLGDAK